VKLEQCDVDKINDTYGSAANIEIVEYRLVGGAVYPLSPKQLIGNNVTLAKFVNALKNLGWTSPDETATPIEMDYVSTLNISYVVVNRVGANPILPPYPILYGANCSSVLSCPSQDPANQLLIKKPDSTLCWTYVCLPPLGPTGPTGAAVVGPTGPQGPPVSTLPIFVETSDSPTGAALSGPVNLALGDTLKIWSNGGIYANVTPGSAILQLEPNNMLSATGAPPPGLPDDESRPFMYLDYANNQLYIWDPNTLDWKLQGGTATPLQYTAQTVDPLNAVFSASPVVDFELNYDADLAYLLIPTISAATIVAPDENFNLPITIPLALRPAQQRNCFISFTSGISDYKQTVAAINTDGTVTIGSKNGFAAPWFGAALLTIYSTTLTYHL
jgi:hypothetical protein